MPTSISLHDRFRGCLLGGALGDALGAPTEFMGIDAIRSLYGPDGIQHLELDKKFRIARYTDDTQLTLAVANGLLDVEKKGRLNPEDTAPAVARRIVLWLSDPTTRLRAPGNACLSGAHALKRGVPWEEAGGQHTNQGAGGCGSVMRSHPYGLFFWNDLKLATQTAARHSRMTHGAPLACAASAALAAGVWGCLRGFELDDVHGLMHAAALTYDVGTAEMLERAFAQAIEGVDDDKVYDRFRGWSGHEAIAAAAFCFQKHVRDGFLPVIRSGANSAGDSDSIASIAGALAGAYLGVGAIDRAWIDAVEDGSEIERVADLLFEKVGVLESASPIT